RLRDWITSPKSTGYEALHITVMGPKNQWVEVQIRSQRMHEIAEKGYAAHYKYKTKETADDVLDNWLSKFQDIIENQETSAVDFVEDFKLSLYAKEIFVFTPDGELKSLPKGATALDFAFAVHTDLGIQTRGAKVNGKLKPLSHELKSGDMVEIISSQHIKPNANWLDFVVTGRAKSKIKSSLNIEKKRIAEEGKELLTRKLKALKITFNEKIVTEMVNYFKLHTSLDLFYRVGIGTIDNQKIKEYANSRSNRLVSYFKSKIKKTEAPKSIDKDEVSDNYDLLVFGKDQQKLDYKLSNCCNPIPGDNVFGFLTVNEGVKVHKYNCPNAISLQSQYAYRILQAKWIDSSQSEYNATLILTGIDRLGLVSQITQTISGTMNVNIKNISFDSNDGIFNGKIALSVKNLNHLNKLIENIKKVHGIDKVIRE
ncbi:MAG: TGS domain-containing protein, partial [Flavobacteriaceae bacterium]|nr:TGS domain-containing protein [Flavobacteriaceae bacterium]